MTPAVEVRPTNSTQYVLYEDLNVFFRIEEREPYHACFRIKFRYSSTVDLRLGDRRESMLHRRLRTSFRTL